MPATSVDLRSEREAPDRTAQQSYREELERQMCEKKAWREREKKEIEAYELKADLKVKQDLAEQEAKAAGPGAARAADKGKENSTRPAPDRTAEQSWREELERQVYEKKVRLEHEKKEIEAYELKADLKLKQDLAELAAGPGAAYKGKENSAVQQDQQQAPQQGQPSQPLAHISKVLPTTEQPIQEGTHDPPTHLDRQPNQGGHDRKPQAARPTHDPPHVDRQLEAEWRQRHISSSAGHISTSADGDLRRQLEHERQRVRQLTDECEALRQREAQQQQQLRAVQERQGEWERRRAQDELEWRSLLEVALHSQGPLGALFGALSGSLSGGAPPLATDAPAAWDTRLRAWAWAWAWAWVAPRTQRRASAAQAAVAAHAASVSTCRQRQHVPPASAHAASVSTCRQRQHVPMPRISRLSSHLILRLAPPRWRRQAEQRMQEAVAQMRREAAVQQQRLEGMLQQLATHASTHAPTHAKPYAPYAPAVPLAMPPWPQGTLRASVADRPAAVTAAPGGVSAYAYGAYGSRPQSAGLSLQPRPGSAALNLHARPGSADLHSWVAAAPPLHSWVTQLPPPPAPSNAASGTGGHATVPSEVGHATVPSEELQKLLEDFLKHGIAPRDGNPPRDGISPRRGEQRTFIT
jgi:hypothetical protein